MTGDRHDTTACLLMYTSWLLQAMLLPCWSGRSVLSDLPDQHGRVEKAQTAFFNICHALLFILGNATQPKQLSRAEIHNLDIT